MNLLNIHPVVVVPDGLEIEHHTNGKVVHLSEIYKSVLDFVLREFINSKIILAPANDFGTGQYEEDIAFDYCLANNSNGLQIYKPTNLNKNKYIDTRGNAHELRNALVSDNLWPENGIILVSAELHLSRAIMCFKKEGFKICKAIGVKSAKKSRYKLVNRLWYYNYPIIHRAYEKLAYIRDFLRPKRGLSN